MDFQLFSDIHLELISRTKFNVNNFPKIKPLSDILFLAGDIGKINLPNYKEFFDYCSSNWKKIFYVLGNHEYYHSHKTIEKLNLEYKNFFTNYSNIHLLDNDIYEIDDYVIIGSTLWSKPSTSDSLNDFTQIKKYNEEIKRKYGIKLEEFIDLHIKSKEFILEQVEKHNGKNIIILTHFPPTQYLTSHPKYSSQEQSIKDYFASNFIVEIPEKHSIKCWLYGHTHYSNDYLHPKGIRMISNQIGYKSDYLDSNLNIDGLYKLPIEKEI
jgi:predicted phosphohydrolase